MNTSAPQTAQAKHAVPDFIRNAVDADRSADWRPLHGGRSNMLWKVTRVGQDPLVVKHYALERSNALFSNDPAAEAAALRALACTALAPELVLEIHDGARRALVYSFVEGPALNDPYLAGQALARVHATAHPAGIRKMDMGPAAIEARAQALTPQRRAPMVSDDPALTVEPVFLHGDPVPANIVVSSQGPTFIDWQTPAIGDPCEDIAIYLSPAMQTLYGGHALTGEEQDRFFSGYGNAQVCLRYAALAPLFHWRMAAYCQWMAAQGNADYDTAYKQEVAALEKSVG